MAYKAGNSINFDGWPLVAAVIENLSAAPTQNLKVGRIYWDTTANGLRIYDGGAWGLKATDSSLLNGQLGSYYLARGNQTGTQPASTISDFATAVQITRLDQFAIPTASINFNSQRGINQADPVNPQDSATKSYVDTVVQSAAAGIDNKASVRLVATAQITLSGSQTIDGVATNIGDRVLARGQTNATQNGVYIVAAGAWTRALDADQNNELTPGAFWFVEEGSTFLKSQWRIENTGTITVGTTNITINQFGAANSYTASNGILLTGSNFTLVPKPAGGLLVDAAGVSIDRTLTPGKFSGTYGDGSAVTFAVNHNLNTTDVIVAVKDSAGNVILIEWVSSSVNTVTVGPFGTAPVASGIRVTVLG